MFCSSAPDRVYNQLVSVLSWALWWQLGAHSPAFGRWYGVPLPSSKRRVWTPLRAYQGLRQRMTCDSPWIWPLGSTSWPASGSHTRMDAHWCPHRCAHPAGTRQRWANRTVGFQCHPHSAQEFHRDQKSMSSWIVMEEEWPIYRLWPLDLVAWPFSCNAKIA